MSRHLGSRTRRDAAHPDSSVSSAQVGAANRPAEILVVGFENAELHDRPLTELQKIDILSAALAIFDGHRQEIETQLELEEALLDAGRQARETRVGGTAVRLDEVFSQHVPDGREEIARAS